MEITLLRASIADAELLWQMQLEAFAPLLARYHDLDTNPANEPLEKTQMRLAWESTYFYFIRYGEENAGAIRVVDGKNGENKRISPLFVLPKFQNKGIAQAAIQAAERLHGPAHWELATILQEAGNCHLYEKMGYRQTERTKKVNEKMTLVFFEK